jgi:Domain of unknown function (DUF3471)
MAGRIFIRWRAQALRLIQLVLATYVGVYELTPTLSIAITLENGQLMEQASNERKFPIFPESPSKFFLKAVDGQLEFFTEPNGQVSHLDWHQYGHDTRWERNNRCAPHRTMAATGGERTQALDFLYRQIQDCESSYCNPASGGELAYLNAILGLQPA